MLDVDTQVQTDFSKTEGSFHYRAGVVQQETKECGGLSEAKGYTNIGNTS